MDIFSLPAFSISFPNKDVEKVLPWAFSTPEPENAISRFLHFQWSIATENGGIPLYRTQVVEKLCFSTACQLEMTG